MSLASNVDKIAFAASFEIDKLWPEKFISSFSVAASSLPGNLGNIGTVAVAHTRGANVLPYMEFSIDNTTWYNAGDMIYNTGPFDPTFSATCYTTSTTIVVVGQNFTAGSLTCYYRIRLISED